MDDEKQVEELNEENDAREEDIVQDTDADEKDTEDSMKAVMDKLDSLFTEIEGIKSGLKALESAQAMFIENGAVINDDSDDSDDSDSTPDNPPKLNGYDDIDFEF